MLGWTKLAAVAAVLGTAGLLTQTSGQACDPEPAQSKDVDVVLCLDVSGSMQGLIESAKNKLWDIVNELAKVKPAPNLRVALYSYGHSSYDPKKGWVRKELDLSNDLDVLYKKLFDLTISGGDEYVTRVSRDAMVEQPWSVKKGSLKLIFVAGNEPANQDPLVSMKEAAEMAKAKDILINPIHCGGQDQTWVEYAKLTGGRLTNIDHNTQVVINTPMDKPLAELAEKLNATYVAYGKDRWKAMNQQEQTFNAAKQGGAVIAGRVAAQNSYFYKCADWDLVDRCKTDAKFDITKVPVDELSDELKKMTPEQRVKYVKDMTAKREGLQKEITELTTKRDGFIREEVKRNPNAAQRAFDTAIRETLRIQAGQRGIRIPE
jgi:hypothetical protein